MPLRFIPNQPFIFESPIGEQSCLNNDDNAYAQIVQPNDTVCVQVAIDPCDEAINCEPSMFAVGSDPGSSTTLGSGWSSSGGNYLFDGSGGVVGNISFTPLAPLVAGVPYQIMLDVNSVTGTCGIFVSLGIDTYATEITEAGSYRFYLICQTTADELVFTMNSLATTAGDTMSINNGSVSRVDFSQCWFDSLPFVYPSWDYTFDLTTLEGKFCSVTDFGDLVNTTAYINDGNYHRVNFTITEATHGGVDGDTRRDVFRYYGRKR
jgi:hypothetical protein